MSKRRRNRPASLSLPHGDPAPRPESAAELAGALSAPDPDVVVRRRRGTYTAIGFQANSDGVGYRSARIAEREGRLPSRAGAVQHERIDRLKLNFQSREFMRNNGLYRGMIRRAVSYIVGAGFRLSVKSKSPRWNRKVERLWKKWWKRPDAKEELSGRRFERMVGMELLTNGDLGVTPIGPKKAEGMEKDRLQIHEAESIIGRQWLEQGIERDPVTGAPIKFWVSPYDKFTGVAQLDKARGFTPAQFFYIADPERPSSVRAVPPCQASFPMLHRINDTCDAEALARQVQARIALIINRTTGPAIAGAIAKKNPAHGTMSGDLTDDYLTEVDYAIVMHGKPGETISGMDRTAPGVGFVESLEMFFRLLGLPLGLPLELILLDWTHSNFAQAKQVLQQAFEAFESWQEILADLFYSKVFVWWLERRIDSGEVEARDDYLEHEFTGPKFPWADMLNEAQAHGELLDRGLTSFAATCRALDAEAEDVRDATEDEVREALKIAAKLEQEFPGKTIPWEIFCGRKAPTASGISAQNEAKDAKNGSKPAAPAKPAQPKRPRPGATAPRRELIGALS